MNKYHIEITFPAENDLREIVKYIAYELIEPDTARKLVRKIGDTVFSLEKFPQRNTLVLDERLSHRGIRKAMVDNFIIFYAITEENQTVTIIRILYGKRDWVNLL